MATPEFRQRIGYVYCVDTPEGYIKLGSVLKLGFTGDIERKARQIARSLDTHWPECQPSISRMIAFLKATQEEEFAVHKQFREYQVQPPLWHPSFGRNHYKREWYKHFTPVAAWFFSQPYTLYKGPQYFSEDQARLFQPLRSLLRHYLKLIDNESRFCSRLCSIPCLRYISDQEIAERRCYCGKNTLKVAALNRFKCCFDDKSIG